jgi:cobalt-zinc-cadmium efflux system membrane fusion protein
MIMKKHKLLIVATFLAATLNTTVQAKETTSKQQTENEQEHQHNPNENNLNKHLTPQVTEGQHTSENKHQNHAEVTSKKEDDHQEENLIELSQAQQDIAGIKTTALELQPLSEILSAPGEIKANGYTSYYVSPRVDSVVIKRHAILGEHVKKGQALVTLFSESVSQAQADYRIAFSDWQRMKNLSNEAVSEQQRLAARTKLVALTSQLKAYGLTEQALNKVIYDDNAPLGEYSLIAERSGAVLSDDFHQGQGIESGETIMILSDESQLWVEARLAPYNDVRLPIGTLAHLEIAERNYQAKIIQAAHTIDPITRTRIVRLSINNTDHQLHSGMFVEVKFSLSENNSGFAVPQAALMRSSDGDWQVFIEAEPNKFQAIEVKLGNKVLSDDKSQQKWQEIIALNNAQGLAIGGKLVISGAFFLASQAAKAGFDTHNH